ncbi:MAG TPA: hypothetical protein VLG11_00035 [Candidatus Saccharimonadales bacterium]|nr:hypothetical protein [Candidatus Saccharimonadales bacterium]
MPIPKPPAGETAPFMLQDATPLQSVDLELTIGVHGIEHFTADFGPYVTGVTDVEYANLAQKVDALKPERGDAFTGEGLNEEPHAALPDWYEYTEAVHALCTYVSQSPYMRPSMYPDAWQQITRGQKPSELLSFADLSMAVHPDIVPNLLEDARRLRIIDPLDYAHIRAVLRDLPAADVDAFSGKFDNNPKVNNSYRRNMEIVQVLNATAGQLADKRKEQSSDERPQLVFAAGECHAKALSYILGKNDVQYELTRFGPPHPLRRQLRAAAFMHQFGVTLPSVRAYARAQIRSWKMNAEAFREERW